MTAEAELHRLLNQSDLIIAQEYLPTEFDWRIGIIDKKPLYACKYYMAKDHWQINQWQSKDKFTEGMAEAISLDKVPVKAINTALRAANAIGDGFYGVDIKQVADRYMVIEINDNPSIDANYEDGVLKQELYNEVMQSILRRIIRKKAS